MSACSLPVSAQEFMDKGPASRLFDIGFRLGVNTSNRTFGKKFFNKYNTSSWGNGFVAGAVVDLNLRDYLSIQPGFFYEIRNSSYSYVQDYVSSSGSDATHTQLGHYRTYNFTVPVMASFHFNLSNFLRWIAEAGPYVQFKMNTTGADNIKVIFKGSSLPGDYETVDATANFVDAGLKIGTGLTWKNHYSLFIHYLGGMRDVWNAPCAGGRNKEWTFTLGYTL